jgi:3,4-dihydroxy 2-butanone 4-phosphate synthase/GTP cyclohydrolase II
MDAIEGAIEDIANGKMIVVVDDDNRENEGDLVMAARYATSEAINFMVTEARGLVCVPMRSARLDALGIGQMTATNTDNHGTAFAISVDHVETTTGISAPDRALTIRALANPASRRSDFRRPGHVFPLAAREGGVLARRGHTEAACDLARLAFASSPDADVANEAGVICEIMNEDGTMARLPDLERFARKHGLKVVSVEDLVEYRRAREFAVTREAEARLPTRYGAFRLYGFTETLTGKEHVALVMGDISGEEPVLCRIHSECLTGDALGSRRCDCGEQYDRAMRTIAEEGRGVLVYLRQEGRGIGLVNKLKAYALQDGGADTLEANVRLGFHADERDYAAGAAILADLGVGRVRLMTNNPEKVGDLRSRGIEVARREPIVIRANADNAFYLRTKAERMNHIMNADANAAEEATMRKERV